MEKIWVVKGEEFDSSEINSLCDRFKIEEPIAKLLWQRGLRDEEEIKKFFNPSLNDLHDPFLMKDMVEATKLLSDTLTAKKHILLLGDYDVDGTTAVATMALGLKQFETKIFHYIPDRYLEGYGISLNGIDYAEENGCSLIISLDCGVKAMDHIAYAKSLGIEVIVCDHHEPGEQLPDALILDPKRKDCNYPFKELSGCGVGFKLLQALYILNNKPQEILFNLLDLVSISIGADIVPVIGENRILAYHGLKKLNAHPRFFIQNMAELSSKKFPFTLTDVVFILAPRINAAGRIRTGIHAVEMMLSEDLNKIKELTNDINNDNKTRRELDESITKEALDIIQNDKSFNEKKYTIVFQSHWNKGVVGIVASRLIEKFYRPTIVLTKSNDMITGSARSVPNFNLYKALHHCQDLLEQFGGHEYAAGLSLKEENYTLFLERFENYVHQQMTQEMMIPVQEIDIQIDLHDIYCNNLNSKIPRLKKAVDAFEPFGPQNMKPVFVSQNLYAIDSKILKEKHLKLKVRQPQSKIMFDAIGFGLAEKENEIGSGVPFEMAFTLEMNDFNGQSNVQLNIKDIREM